MSKLLMAFPWLPHLLNWFTAYTELPDNVNFHLLHMNFRLFKKCKMAFHSYVNLLWFGPCKDMDKFVENIFIFDVGQSDFCYK